MLQRDRKSSHAHLSLVLPLEHGEQLGDDLIRHALDVCPALDGADGVDVRHLLEHAVRAHGHSDLSSPRKSENSKERKEEEQEEEDEEEEQDEEQEEEQDEKQEEEGVKRINNTKAMEDKDE